ncbi:MAG TPA: TMEM165/GDT1 family protein [Acidimicrobiia bacterium]
MSLAIAVAVFPVIFVGELPDKTMFASLVLSSRGNPAIVWLGAAAAFLVHVAIATTIGVGLFKVLPHRAVEAFVTGLFAAGAVLAFLEAGKEDEESLVDEEETVHHGKVLLTAFSVIFIAEWGDLTQILTANLAAHYHSAISVGVGATAALWTVAAIAVVSGQGLMRRVPVKRVRQLTGVILVVLAIVSAVETVRG